MKYFETHRVGLAFDEAGSNDSEDAVAMDHEIEEVWAHVGNVLRLASIVRPEEASACQAAAEREAVHILLVDPRLPPMTRRDHVLNYRLLAAFSSFRQNIEAICREHQQDEGEPCES